MARLGTAISSGVARICIYDALVCCCGQRDDPYGLCEKATEMGEDCSHWVNLESISTHYDRALWSSK